MSCWNSKSETAAHLFCICIWYLTAVLIVSCGTWCVTHLKSALGQIDVHLRKHGMRCTCRRAEAERINRLAVQLLEGSHDDKCSVFSAHCLGLATALRQAGNMHDAEHMLQQAELHSSSDDCSRGLYALEHARLARDSGHVEAALSELEQCYEYFKHCDEDAKLTVIDIALEVAWEFFIAGKWVDAKVWFSKAFEMVSVLQLQSCMLLAAVSHAGLAAAQLQAGSSITLQSMADAEQRLQQVPCKLADGCQVAHMYLAVCYRLVGSSSKAQQHLDCATDLLHEVCAPNHPYSIACDSVYARASETVSAVHVHAAMSDWNV